MSEKPEDEEAEGQPEAVVPQLRLVVVLEMNPEPHYVVAENSMNPYVLPTLLRQLAKNYEEVILKTRSLLE